MLTVCFSALLVTLGVTVGLGVPLSCGALRATFAHPNATHHLELDRQRAIIADYEATIDAYRQFVQHDPELSLTSR